MDARGEGHGWCRLPCVAVLLLAACVLPPVPIDETRYLAVAWNMHWSGQWLVPWLDGAPYPDKPPLLFWLLNMAWAVTGVHAWSARALEAGLALLTLPLLRGLARELGADAAAASSAGWLWLGSLAFAAYAGTVMFDMLLCVCVLVAWLGSVWLWSGRIGGGAVALALGLGAGLLAKGPVSLLAGGLPAVLGPWWYPQARGAVLRPYLAVATAVLAAVALALAWAIPAAWRGGPAYANAILLGQTAGRVAGSFAHDRGLAWYLPIVPVLLLPWVASLGRAARGATERPRVLGVPGRFALAATLPTFLAFCVISGKQPHYLLPLLPALAPAAGVQLADGRWKVVGWRVGGVLLAIPLGAALALARLAPQAPRASEAGLMVAGLLGLALLLRGRRMLRPWVAAALVIAVVALTKAAFLVGTAPRYAVDPAARRVAAAQRAGTPLLVVGAQNGLFTFAGRLTAPIPTAPDQRAVALWATRHPDGWVISSYDAYDYAAPPLYRQPFLDRRLAIWRAADVARDALAQSEVRHQPRGGD